MFEFSHLNGSTSALKGREREGIRKEKDDGGREREGGEKEREGRGREREREKGDREVTPWLYYKPKPKPNSNLASVQDKTWLLVLLMTCTITT